MLTPTRLFAAIGAAAIVAVAAPVPLGAAAGCPLSDQEFFSELRKVQDWNGIYDLVKRRLPGCPDDGVYAEGYSDAIVHTLAKGWSYLPQLVSLVARNPGFHSFVLRHINATADRHELRQTRHQAKTECPPDAEDLCREIATRAGDALRHR
ncbi:MAG TPA: hypothetical protein VEH00_06960 [Steroidobacteraceae bacterium]|nr:hypothetical protein [Steroidobacteraceae bacterium]